MTTNRPPLDPKLEYRRGFYTATNMVIGELYLGATLAELQLWSSHIHRPDFDLLKCDRETISNFREYLRAFDDVAWRGGYESN
jgi:hypothetical protein